MRRFVSALGALACLTQAGCYHQVFNTGLAPSSTVVKKGWQPTYIFGLIAGQPIDVRGQCPSGVALASTRMTFANGLVGGLTLGLFTPHEVKVVCASSAAVLPGMQVRQLAATASRAVAEALLTEAVETASRDARGVAIVFEPTTAATVVSQEAGR